MVRPKNSPFHDESLRDHYRPSIARLTLDLDHGPKDVDGTETAAAARSSEALMHRLTELLVFEIRQEGETRMKTLSVRGLYKYVMSAIKYSGEKQLSSRRVLDPTSNQSPLKAKNWNTNDHPGLHYTGTANKDDTSNTNKNENDESILSPEKSTKRTVSFGELPLAESKIPGTPLVALEKEFQSAGSLVEDSPKAVHGRVTYRERLGGFLHPRDMRRLVTPFSASNEPELIVRRHVMLLNFDPLRAVILRDRLLVLVPDGADSLLVDLEKRVVGGVHKAVHDMFGEAATKSEVSNIESSVAGDSQHSSNADAPPEVPNVNRQRPLAYSPAPKKSKHTPPSTNPNFSVPFSLFGSGTASTVEDEDATEFQEFDEMDREDWANLPFELLCVDAVLGSVVQILGNDAHELRTNSIQAIDDLVIIGSGGEEILRHIKNSSKEMMQRVKGFIRAMNLVLDESEDMALMNLSRLLTHPERFIQPVPEEILNEESDEPELILESHLQQAISLTNALDLVQGEIESTQDLISQRLDGVRNRLLLANMIISMGSLLATSGALVGAFFGMNVKNYVEDDPDVFMQIVVGTAIGLLAMVVLFVLLMLWSVGRPHDIRKYFSAYSQH